MEKSKESMHTVVITDIQQVTHNVKQFRMTKPQGYAFRPGQATEVAIAADGLRDEKRPFTFTGLNEWDYLEFIIKIYNDHNGVTKQLGKLRPGDELLIGDPWGAITYKGPGTFIAGGAGITPFIAILRDLARSHKLEGNRLLFSNKTHWDIILEEELRELLHSDFINTLSNEKLYPYEHGRINAAFLKKYITDPSGHFYICGPDGMIKSIQEALAAMQVAESSVVVEM